MWAIKDCHDYSPSNLNYVLYRCLSGLTLVYALLQAFIGSIDILYTIRPGTFFFMVHLDGLDRCGGTVDERGVSMWEMRALKSL